MSLPKPPEQYSKEDQAVTRGLIDKGLNSKVGKGEILDKFLMRDTATGVVKTVVITSGAFVIS